MLQKIKEIGGKVFATSLEKVKRHGRPLLCLTLVVCSVFLSGGSYSVFAEVQDETVISDTAEVGRLSVVKKPAIEDSEFKPTTLQSNLDADRVVISYLFPVEVKTGGTISTYSVYSGTVEEILNSIGIELDSYDTVDKPLDSFIDKATSLEVTDIDYKSEIMLEAIPFGSKTEYSAEYSLDSTLVIEGEEGQKETVFSIKYVNGELTETTVVSERVTKPAVDRVVVLGTALESGEAVPAASANTISKLEAPDDLLLDKDGAPLDYSKKTVLKATAYTHTGLPCSTGVYPKPGYVAVDPTEIPYGTKMYIVSADGKYVYGYAIAADTGGFIYNSDTGMDLFFNSESECVTFGRRDIVVYFVD